MMVRHDADRIDSHRITRTVIRACGRCLFLQAPHRGEVGGAGTKALSLAASVEPISSSLTTLIDISLPGKLRRLWSSTWKPTLKLPFVGISRRGTFNERG
jgi:hypothetical protein